MYRYLCRYLWDSTPEPIAKFISIICLPPIVIPAKAGHLSDSPGRESMFFQCFQWTPRLREGDGFFAMTYFEIGSHHRHARQLTSISRTSTQHLIEGHQIGEPGKVNGDQTLLRAIERTLRVQNAQVAVDPAFVSQI